MDVTAVLRADISNFSRGMNNARKAMVGLKDESSKLKAVGGNISALGKGLTMGLTLPLVGVVGAAVKVGSAYEAEMSKVEAISGATEQQLKALNDQALLLGAETAFSAKEAAEGMGFLAMAGFEVEDIMSAMPGVLDMAAASGMELGAAADITSNIMSGFAMEGDEASRVADVLAKSAASSNTDVSQLGQAMKYVAPIAATLGLSMEESAAAIGILSDAGIQGSQAGTVLRAAMSRLANPTSQASDLMEELGFNAFDAEGNLKPMEQIIGELGSSMSGMTAEQKAQSTAIMFGQEAMGGMLALVNNGPEAFGELTNSLIDSEGAAKDMADTMLNNLEGSITILKGSLETAAIAIQQVVAPALKEMVERITELVNKFTALDSEQQANILKWVGIVAAAGPVLLILGKIISVVGVVVGFFVKVGAAIGAAQTALTAGAGAAGALKAGMLALMGPVGWITALVLAVVAAGVALWMNWDTVKAKAAELGTYLSGRFTEIKESVVTAVSGMVEGVKEWWANLRSSTSSFFSGLGESIVQKWNDIKTGTVEAVVGMKNSVMERWNEIKTGVVETVTGLYTSLVERWNAIKTSVVTTVTGIKDDAVAAFNTLKTNISTVMTTIWTNIMTVWNTIKVYLQGLGTNVVNNLTNAFGGLITTLQGIWTSIKTAASAAWELIKIAIVTPVLLLLQLVTGDFEGMRSTIAQVWTKIKTNASQLWTSIKDTVAGLAKALKIAVLGVFTLLWTGVKRTFDQVKTFATTVWTTIKTNVVNAATQLKNSVVNTIIAMKNSVVQWFTTTKTNAITQFNNLKTGAATAITNMKNSVIQGVINMKNNAITQFNNLKTSASNAITNMKNAIVQGVINMRNSVIQWFTNTKTSAVTQANVLKTQAVQAIRNLVTSAGAAIRALPGKIREGFNSAIRAAKSFVSQAVSVGKNLIMGFVTGIKNKAGELVSSVKGAVDGAINGAKKLLGIRSPSRVFAYFGKMTDEGFGQGVKKNARKAIKPVTDLAKNISGAFDPKVDQFSSNFDAELASSTAQVNSTVQHEFDDTPRKQPAYINFQMGGHSYRAFVEDISTEQGRIIDLEEDM